MKLLPALIVFPLFSALVFSQQPKPAPTPPPGPPALVTPEVHSDNSVTFRFRAPKALQVKLAREGLPEQLPMQKDDSGVWTANSPSWPPDYYGYSIIVDGARSIDPYNPLL